MKAFGVLLAVVALLLLGALGMQVLQNVDDPVLLRVRGVDYVTTTANAALLLLGAIAAVIVLWSLLRAPFNALRMRRLRLSRDRLIDGLDALHRGDWTRAEQALARAADVPEAAAVARVHAAHAAASRGDAQAALHHLDALGGAHAASRAIAQGELALSHGRAEDALRALDAPDAQPLPPRGQALRAEALALIGRHGEAYGMTGALRQHKVWPDARITRNEAVWAEAALAEAQDGNALAAQWDALPKALRTQPRVASAYAERAQALGWHDAAGDALEAAIDAQDDAARIDTALATRYAQLPGERAAQRAGHIDRWLARHPDAPGLHLARFHALRQRGDDVGAELALRHAIERGGGTEAWEAMAERHAASGNHAAAQEAYANALRASRGEVVRFERR